MSDPLSSLTASPTSQPAAPSRTASKTERAGSLPARLNPHQARDLRDYHQQALETIDQVRQLNGSSDLVKRLDQGDFAFLTDLEEREAAKLVSSYLEQLATRLDHTQGEQRQAVHRSAQQAFQFVHDHPHSFPPAALKQAAQAAEALSPGHIENALQLYARDLKNADPANFDSLAKEVADRGQNMHQLYYKIMGFPGESSATLTQAQQKAVARALRQRLGSADFQLSDADMVKAMLARLGQDPTPDAWAELLSHTVQQRLEHPPAGQTLADFTRAGGIQSLAEALEAARGESREKLLTVIRRLYPQLHYQDRSSLEKASGGKDQHGYFVPHFVREGNSQRADPIQAQFDRMGSDTATPDDFAAALEELRRRKTSPQQWVGYSLEALQKTDFKDTARFLDPLLGAADPGGEIAAKIAEAAFSADSAELYGSQPGHSLGLLHSSQLLEYLTAHQQQPLARQAAQRLLLKLSGQVGEKQLSLSARSSLLKAVVQLPPGAETLTAALRLKRDVTSSVDSEKLDKVIEQSQDLLFKGIRDMAGKPESRPEIDEALERLGFAYEAAVRGQRQGEAEQLKKILNRAVAETAGLPAHGDWMPAELGPAFVWNRYDSRNHGSYLRDFTTASGQLSPERRQQLVERLGDLPTREWKEAPLGFRRGTSAASMREIHGYNEFSQDLHSLRLAIQEAERCGDSKEAERLRLRVDERIQQHERYQAATTGLTGRLEAASRLGEGFAELVAYAKQRKLSPEAFDKLLMQIGEMARRNGPDLAQRLLSAATQAEGMDPAQLLTVLEVAGALPLETLNQVIQQSDSAQALGQGLADLSLRRLRSYAHGEPERQLFDRPGMRPSLGEKMAGLVIAEGRAVELMLDEDGGTSLVDRLTLDGHQRIDSRRAALGLLQQLDPQPTQAPSSASQRLARLNRLQYQHAFEPSSPDKILTELAGLRVDPQSLPAQQARLQQLTNLEVSVTQAEVLANSKHTAFGWQDKARLVQASAELEQLQQQVKADQQGLPADLAAEPRFRGLSGQLEGARRVLAARQTQALAKLGQIQEGEEKRRLAEQLQFQGGMGYKSVRSLVTFALNSPTDSVFLAVNAKAGVQVNIPFFGKAEAFVEGRAGFEIAVEEAGQVSVSFDARIGVGAGVSSDRLGARLEGKKGSYSKVRYVFANEDEAAKFITSILHQLGATEENPSYNPPLAVQHKGTFSQVEGEFHGARGSYKTRKDQAEVSYQVPWLPRNQIQSAHILTLNEEMGLTVPVSGRDIGMSLATEDQSGNRNESANGTDLTIAFEMGKTVSTASTQRLLDSPTEQFIEELVESVFKMRPELLKRIPGHDTMTPEQLRKAARERLLQSFTSADIKASATARGKLEITVSSEKNLMRDQKLSPEQVLFNFVDNALAEKPENPWYYKTTRVAAELSAEASLRLQYGAVVSVFAEIGVEAGLRQAETLKGSLWHAREVLYESRPGTYFSENQLAELKKDGLIRADDTLDRDAFVVVLAKIRQELVSRFDDPKQAEWRAQNVPGQTREVFLANIDGFLEEVSRSMWAGLKNSRRNYESFDDFSHSISLPRVRDTHQLMLDQQLQDASSDQVLEKVRARR